MNPAHSSRSELSCVQFVDLVTAYLERALPDDVRARIDAHLAHCAGCRNVLEQWRTVIRLAGQLTDAEVERTDPLTRDRLLSMFRELRRR